MDMKVPNVPPLCIMVFPTPPISSLPRMPILQAEERDFFKFSIQRDVSRLFVWISVPLQRFDWLVKTRGKNTGPLQKQAQLGECAIETYLRQEKVPNMAPAAIPTANPIMKPILTRSKQLGWVCPYGPTATGIWDGRDRVRHEKTTDEVTCGPDLNRGRILDISQGCFLSRYFVQSTVVGAASSGENHSYGSRRRTNSRTFDLWI